MGSGGSSDGGSGCDEQEAVWYDVGTALFYRCVDAYKNYSTTLKTAPPIQTPQ